MLNHQPELRLDLLRLDVSASDQQDERPETEVEVAHRGRVFEGKRV